MLKKKKMNLLQFFTATILLHVYTKLDSSFDRILFSILPIKINIKYSNSFGFGTHSFPFSIYVLALFIFRCTDSDFCEFLFLYVYATLPQFKTQFTKLMISSTNPKMCVCVFIGVCWHFFSWAQDVEKNNGTFEKARKSFKPIQSYERGKEDGELEWECGKTNWNKNKKKMKQTKCKPECETGC